MIVKFTGGEEKECVCVCGWGGGIFDTIVLKTFIVKYGKKKKLKEVKHEERLCRSLYTKNLFIMV